MANPSHFALILLTTIVLPITGANVEMEEGYRVTTVLDGNKRGLNPHSVLPLSLSSSHLILLDSVASAFYTLSFSTSPHQQGLIEKYAGRGVPGYADGELSSAMFNKPKSFALDSKGNVYVADKTNHAIRKITNSGVTTIAGGFSQKSGRADGPAQNASFSDDFELAFIPGICALIISDHGNKLLRQINLKVEDCPKHSEPKLGSLSAWIMTSAVGFLCLCIGLIVGFYIRPYVARHEGFSQLHFSGTWKHFLTSLGRRALIHCFAIRSAVVSSALFVVVKRLIILSLSHMALVFNLRSEYWKKSSKNKSSKIVSLLDNDNLACSEVTKSQRYANELNDLLTLDRGLESSYIMNEEAVEEKCLNKGPANLHNSLGNIERMIQGNLIGFVEQAKITSSADQVGSSSLINRKRNVK